MGVLKPELIFKSIVPVIMAGILGIYGLIISLLVFQKVRKRLLRIKGTRIELNADYGQLSGKVEIGVRPEFCSFSDDGSGLMVKVKRIEDVGRHKIVRTSIAGIELNVISPSSARIPADTCHVKFDLSAINVYVDGWRVEGSSINREAAS